MNIEPKWTWKSQATNQDIKGGNIYQVRAKAMTRKRIYMNQNIEEGHKATVFPIRVYICDRYVVNKNTWRNKKETTRNNERKRVLLNNAKE